MIEIPNQMSYVAQDQIQFHRFRLHRRWGDFHLADEYPVTQAAIANLLIFQ